MPGTSITCYGCRVFVKLLWKLLSKFHWNKFLEFKPCTKALQFPSQTTVKIRLVSSNFHNICNFQWNHYPFWLFIFNKWIDDAKPNFKSAFMKQMRLSSLLDYLPVVFYQNTTSLKTLIKIIIDTIMPKKLTLLFKVTFLTPD